MNDVFTKQLLTITSLAFFTGIVGIACGDGPFVAVRERGTIPEPAALAPSITEPAVGRVIAWGDGGAAKSHLPPGLTNVIAIAAGGLDLRAFAYISTSVALKADGTLVYWNYSEWGAFTNILADLTNVVAIADNGHCCSLMLMADGTVNAIAGLTNIVAISAKTTHALALRADGTVVSVDIFSGVIETPLIALSNVVAIAAGGSGGREQAPVFDVALKADSTVTAWGANNSGQTDVPAGLSNVVAIAAGQSHSLALKADGTVVAWGDDSLGQVNVPANLTNVIAVAAAAPSEDYYRGYSLALKANGTVVAWGAGAAGQTNVPAGLTNVTAIAAGYYRALALVGDGPPVIQALITNPRRETNPRRDTPGFSCSISSQSGRVFRLEYKNSLAETNWMALPLVAGNGGLLTLTDPTASGPQRFYRVRRW